MRRTAGVVFAIATAGLTPALANAEGGYEASPVSAAPENGTLIETGERVAGSLTMTNVGTLPWKENVTLVPGDGATIHTAINSVLADESWISTARIRPLRQVPVAVGENGTFDFTLKGPPVSGKTEIRQYLIPVAEGEYWMDSAAGTGTWPVNQVHLNLTVLPTAPPAVTVDAAPLGVVAGQTVPVTATATDNVRVKTIAARIDNEPVVPLTGSPANGLVPTTGIAPGAHTLTVAAVDGSGNVGVASAPLTISEDTGLPNGTPSGPATVTAGLSQKRRKRLQTRAGKTPEIGGRLRAAGTNTPIAGARLDIQARPRGSSRWRTVKAVSTDRLGRYETRLPAGPSRAVRVVYRALTKQASATATAAVRVDTRAPVTLRVKRRGRTVRLIGRVTGAPFPSGGVLVSLQGRQSGDKWRPFLNVRARGRQRRFSGRYRFGGRGRFALRAVVNEQAGYPYTRGASRVRKVSIR